MNNKEKDIAEMPIGAVEKELRKYRSKLLKNGKVDSVAKEPFSKFGRTLKGAIPKGNIFINVKEHETLNYRNNIAAFRKETSIEQNFGRINSVVNELNQFTRKILGDHDENLKVAKVLMENDWVTSEFFYNDILKMNYNKSEEDILKYIENFYLENNYEKFFRIFGLIIDSFQDLRMNEGYRLQLIRIRNIISHDFNNYDLMINNLFSIAEYVCAFQFDLLSNNDYINKKSIKSSRKKYTDENGQLTAIDMLSFFTVLKKWWTKADFKVGLEKTKFNRNTVEHGRFDPRRFTEVDFIKIIVFIFNAVMSPTLRND
ncbi:hypothetical protein [Lactobacillus helsingborgensis]|uniref:hypothetical protein n=1 Tax=Lactobacillus helsingborgensis TaxID=1218494 RepID=UPI0022650636|nr:hypothetical protein [Lactobacillus helsingborgensis]UZX31152.1 hypothetical protein LDX52_07240 [Lactobacillus helsingborgensis]